MITFEGVEYHVVSSPNNRCKLDDGTLCHFDFGNCSGAIREHHPCAGNFLAIYLTHDEYIAHMARKFTS